MERLDHKKTVHQAWDEAPYRIGSNTVDASTAELIGTRREADLIVRALHVLRAQVTLCEAVGMAVVEGRDRDDASLGPVPNQQEIDVLIESIGKPVYAGEPEVIYERLE